MRTRERARARRRVVLVALSSLLSSLRGGEDEATGDGDSDGARMPFVSAWRGRGAVRVVVGGVDEVLVVKPIYSAASRDLPNRVTGCKKKRAHTNLSGAQCSEVKKKGAAGYFYGGNKCADITSYRCGPGVRAIYIISSCQPTTTSIRPWSPYHPSSASTDSSWVSNRGTVGKLISRHPSWSYFTASDQGTRASIILFSSHHHQLPTAVLINRIIATAHSSPCGRI